MGFLSPLLKILKGNPLRDHNVRQHTEEELRTIRAGEIFSNFLELQSIALKASGQKANPNDNLFKVRYLHFLMGAIDNLSDIFKDEKIASDFFHSCSCEIASNLFDKNLVAQVVGAYGRFPESPGYLAGKVGWMTMQTYLEGMTQNDTNKMRSTYKALHSIVFP